MPPISRRSGPEWLRQLSCSVGFYIICSFWFSNSKRSRFKYWLRPYVCGTRRRGILCPPIGHSQSWPISELPGHPRISIRHPEHDEGLLSYVVSRRHIPSTRVTTLPAFLLDYVGCGAPSSCCDPVLPWSEIPRDILGTFVFHTSRPGISSVLKFHWREGSARVGDYALLTRLSLRQHNSQTCGTYVSLENKWVRFYVQERRIG